MASIKQATDVTIASIFARYYEKHGQHLSSYDSVKRNLEHWLDFHGEATLEEAADLRQQEIFRSWLQRWSYKFGPCVKVNCTLKRTIYDEQECAACLL